MWKKLSVVKLRPESYLLQAAFIDLIIFSKTQQVVYHQCCVLIG